MTDPQQELSTIALELLFCRISKRRLAKELEVSRTSIYSWDQVPAKHCALVEAVSGVPRAWLRPDLFGGEYMFDAIKKARVLSSIEGGDQ